MIKTEEEIKCKTEDVVPKIESSPSAPPKTRSITGDDRRRSKREREVESPHAKMEVLPHIDKPRAAGKRRATKMAEPAEGPDAGPYPNFSGPSQDEVLAVHAALSYLHPDVVARVRAPEQQQGGCGLRETVLDALVGTILSQNTTDVNSHRAFAKLKAQFPTWEEVRTADPPAIEEAIRSGGLAAIKTGRVQAILNSVHEERGECSLEHLRAEPDEVVKATLRQYKGVGAKTISCVLMFCLKRHDFPVDTHVWKIALALGWVPKTADRDGTYEHLNRRVPPEVKYELHVLLVQHGKDYKNDVKLLRATMRELAGAPLECD